MTFFSSLIFFFLSLDAAHYRFSPLLIHQGLDIYRFKSAQSRGVKVADRKFMEKQQKAAQRSVRQQRCVHENW